VDEIIILRPQEYMYYAHTVLHKENSVDNREESLKKYTSKKFLDSNLCI
jgi:hypothetical protein